MISQRSQTMPDIGAHQLFAKLAQSEFEVVRLGAVQALRDTGGASQADVLIAALMDEDEDVRQDAAQALGILGIVRAIPQLLDNLQNDPDGDVKLACVISLGQLGAARAVAPLRALTGGREGGIIWDETEFFQSGWDDWLDVQIAAITALGQLRDKGAIEPIKRALSDPNGQELAPVATAALAMIGKASLPTLGAMLQSPHRRVRFHAVGAITRIGGNAAEGLLLEALNDRDGETRLLAYKTLLGPTPDADLLIRAMEDPDPHIRVMAFGKLRLEDRELLDRILNDPAPEVQLAMIGRLDLSTTATDTDDLRFRVLDFFAEHGKGEAAARAFGALAAIATDHAAPRLTQLFDAGDDVSQNQEQRQWAVVDALSRSGLLETGEWLQIAARSPFRAVRLKALAAMGQILDDESRPHVTRQQARELILSFALPRAPLPPEFVTDDRAGSAGETDVTPAKVDGAAGLAAAGLDTDTNAPPETGPQSSLGAILGHEELAQEMIEEAVDDTGIETLSPREQALLARTRSSRTWGRRVALENGEEALERETRLTALRLLGVIQDIQPLLVSLLDKNDVKVSATVLAALAENISRFGLTLEAAEFSDLLGALLGNSEAELRLAALRMMPLAGQLTGQQLARIRAALQDESAHIRREALIVALDNGQPARFAENMLADRSPLVRQMAMKLLVSHDAETAAARMVPFLLENPEQHIEFYLKKGSKTAEVVKSALLEQLSNPEKRSTWPVILTAFGRLAGRSRVA